MGPIAVPIPSFQELENCGNRVGTCPQDALLGLPHLLRLKEGMHLGAKWGHKLSLGFYPSPDLPSLEKAPSTGKVLSVCKALSLGGTGTVTPHQETLLKARMEQDNC